MSGSGYKKSNAETVHFEQVNTDVRMYETVS